jgi:DNA-binding CsgD family transcriptional regulator
MTAIVGRERELRIGEAFVRDVAAGPTLLLIDGEAGIGKTTLWAAIAHHASATGLTVLRSQPTAAETSLTFSAFADLLATVPEAALEPLPAVQRRAIDVALFRAEPTGRVAEQGLLGAATRSVLLSLATVRPLVLAIDDLQWIDPPSAAILSYALRRIGDARVGILVAQRSGEESPIDLASLPSTVARHHVPVTPLSLAAMHHLLKDRLGTPLPRSSLVRIHDASGGRPLFALEMARMLRDRSDSRDDEPLPVPSTVREFVRRRVQALQPSTRAVLVAASAHRDPTVASVAAAVERDVADDLDIAEREQVARVHEGRVTFAHPLFAAAIYAETPAAERRDLHGRLARTVADLEERARHRALASYGPDGGVASELERAAESASARAAPLAAADLLRIALRMTPADEVDAVDKRKLALGRALKLGGDATEAAHVLEDAARSSATRRARARALLVLANVVFELDPGPRAAPLAAEALADAEDDAELMTEAHATLAAVDYDDWRQAAYHAREAKRLLADVPDPSPALESLVLYGYASAEIRDGQPLPAEAIERALELERIAPTPIVSDRLSASLGYWLFLTADDLEGGRHWMEATYRAAVEEGDEGSIPYALSHRALLEFAAGDWATAEAYARRHLAAARDAGTDSNRLDALFGLVQVLVHQGRESEARPLIDELLRDAEAAGSLWDLTKGLTALGALELARGETEAAARHLLEVEEGRNRLGDEQHRRHEGDLVEALIALGRLDAARDTVATIERRARRYRRHSRLAVAARCRALLSAAEGDLDGAITYLEEALREHELAPFPFERARTELVLGRVRRRRRERSLAKAAFESALAAFDQLGATLWAQHARAELDRVGLRRGTGTTLTEGERRVAELVASGRTVADAAAMLFVSHRTAEANLSRAYRKLGIGSRAELGAIMGGRTVPPEEGRRAAE